MSFVFFPLNLDADLEAEGLADLISTFFPSTFSGPLIDSFKASDRVPFGGAFERAEEVKFSAVLNADFNAVFNGALLLSLEALPIVLGTLSQKRISVNTQKWVYGKAPEEFFNPPLVKLIFTSLLEGLEVFGGKCVG